MAYNWEEILRSKTEKELIKSYAGYLYLDIEGEMFAGLELKRRKFNFEEIEQIQTQKQKVLKKEIEEYENSEFSQSKYLKEILYGIIGSIVFLGLDFWMEKGFWNVEKIDNYRVLIYIIPTIISAMTAKWRFNMNLRKLKKAINLKQKTFRKINKVNRDY